MPASRHAEALSRSLELRDEAGVLVPTDYIELMDWPGGSPEVSALIGLRESQAHIPAYVPSRPKTDSDTELPAA